MGIPEAKMNRSRKGSRLCLNSKRVKDIPGDRIAFSDSAPSSPELRKDNENCFFGPSMDHKSENT